MGPFADFMALIARFVKGGDSVWNVFIMIVIIGGWVLIIGAWIAGARERRRERQRRQRPTTGGGLMASSKLTGRRCRACTWR